MMGGAKQDNTISAVFCCIFELRIEMLIVYDGRPTNNAAESVTLSYLSLNFI